ncbi:pentapeptide repeat-containing protein [Candidatus Sororendozoicomonas aggregata]|uniref:pentapeptide repeat-containing protein n=1 Tax=Candidatus Sororendozoicomonas aggregata TaxID=3073239 RepID=UPI002ED1649D
MTRDAKPDDNKKPEKPKGTLGRTAVLNIEGLKTQGLSDKNPLSAKDMDQYNVDTKDDVEVALYEEKQRTRRIKALLDSLHPACQMGEDDNFRGMVLCGRDLTHSRFIGSVLKNTKLRECQLRGVVFKNCDLSGADFRKADMSEVIFDHCNLNGADFRHCALSNARIIDSNLFAINLDYSILDQSVIDSCEMGAQSFFKASCKGITLSNSQIIHGFFDSANMAGAKISHMLFRDCTLTNTHFEGAVFDNCCFRACDSIQEGPVFSQCTMNHIAMEDCEFEDIKMVDTHINHSRIERVTMDTALLEGAVFNNVVFDSGTMRDCYSLEEAPSFTHCKLEHIVIDHSELINAHFNKSAFIGARIIASDFEAWEMKHTGIDGNTTVDSGF